MDSRFRFFTEIAAALILSVFSYTYRISLRLSGVECKSGCVTEGESTRSQTADPRNDSGIRHKTNEFDFQPESESTAKSAKGLRRDAGREEDGRRVYLDVLDAASVELDAASSFFRASSKSESSTFL